MCCVIFVPQAPVSNLINRNFPIFTCFSENKPFWCYCHVPTYGRNFIEKLVEFLGRCQQFIPIWNFHSSKLHTRIRMNA